MCVVRVRLVREDLATACASESSKIDPQLNIVEEWPLYSVVSLDFGVSTGATVGFS